MTAPSIPRHVHLEGLGLDHGAIQQGILFLAPVRSCFWHLPRLAHPVVRRRRELQVRQRLLAHVQLALELIETSQQPGEALEAPRPGSPSRTSG